MGSTSLENKRLCECGCGAVISILDKKGRPHRFIQGHNSKGERHHAWNGGRIIQRGYVKIKSGGKYVFEHRLIMEKELGRKLLDKEVIHHINGNTLNNNISNLMLFCDHKKHLSLEMKGRPKSKEHKEKIRQGVILMHHRAALRRRQTHF